MAVSVRKDACDGITQFEHGYVPWGDTLQWREHNKSFHQLPCYLFNVANPTVMHVCRHRHIYLNSYLLHPGFHLLHPSWALQPYAVRTT